LLKNKIINKSPPLNSGGLFKMKMSLEKKESLTEVKPVWRWSESDSSLTFLAL